MRRIPLVIRLLGVLLAVAACHRAPAEPLALDDAGDASPATLDAAAGEAGDEAAPDDGGTARLRAFCIDAYTADAARLKTSCSAADFMFMQNIARVSANLCFSDLTAALSRQRAVFDEGAAQRCVEMLRSKQLAQASEDDSLFQHPPCDRVLEGLQGERQACRFSIECKDGLACVGATRSEDGSCRKPPKAKETCSAQPFGSIVNDATAGRHHPACAPGAWCDGSACQRRAGAGEGCASGASCAPGLGCVMARCAARQPLGGACTKGTDCTFGLWCEPEGDGGAGHCSAKRADGEPCVKPESCKGRCDVPKSAATGAPVTFAPRAPANAGVCKSVCGSG